MSGISPISSYSYGSYTAYGKIASGKQILSAADGASESAIIQKMDSQARGYEVGADNIATSNDMLKVADGAMEGITGYLQRMRELALQASNSAIYSAGDISSIQAEIEQMKQGISDIASQTMFNGKQLLNGTGSSMNVVTDANGSSMSIQMPNSLLEELGIADFDVTKEFDIDAIDEAINKVSSGRSSLGAKSNALEHAYNYTRNTGLNTIGSKSRLEDLDIPQAISDLKKNQLLQEYSMNMQRKRMEDEQNRMRNLFF